MDCVKIIQSYMHRLGIYDMSGNVYEWCVDWCDVMGISSNETVTNSIGAASGSSRILCGGSYHHSSHYSTVSRSIISIPYDCYNLAGYGFRLARSIH